ncbi:hypothetical protein CRENPOLYSF1_240037 [Crenothrix polyspora]|uniref:Uncharacterized protein n=1 Tax=Crenothrix polyspora TaxID=360316 RepID=A0A1R4H8B2_9GAMM|nr:hypothetical protein CRENPOLYSF1_240037 [Crenothrix polyspora]
MIFGWMNHEHTLGYACFFVAETCPEKIPQNVLTAYYDTNNDIFLSIVSIWEMQIKHQLASLTLNCRSVH